jgi:hypothetical protein
MRRTYNGRAVLERPSRFVRVRHGCGVGTRSYTRSLIWCDPGSPTRPQAPRGPSGSRDPGVASPLCTGIMLWSERSPQLIRYVRFTPIASIFCAALHESPKCQEPTLPHRRKVAAVAAYFGLLSTGWEAPLLAPGAGSLRDHCRTPRWDGHFSCAPMHPRRCCLFQERVH